MKTKSAATITIKDSARMSLSGRRAVYRWLLKQAKFFNDHHKDLSTRFTARYLYQAKV